MIKSNEKGSDKMIKNMKKQKIIEEGGKKIKKVKMQKKVVKTKSQKNLQIFHFNKDLTISLPIIYASKRTYSFLA